MFDAWLGREEISEDVITRAPLARLAAMLDHERAPWAPGDVPPLGHWLFHLPVARQSELGPDGHAARGGFLPPLPQPRRMWVGGGLRFLAPIRLGAVTARRSTIESIVTRDSADGQRVFVTIRHLLSAGGIAAIEEEQVLAFLPASAGPSFHGGGAQDREPESVRTIQADERLLFRFSALTFNAHRIHYDAGYAARCEGYPAPVVQGPLQAILLVDHLLRDRPETKVESFTFRARAPLFAGADFDLCRAGTDAWVRTKEGRVTMAAQFSLS